MSSKLNRLKAQGLDLQEWQKYYNRHQQEYKRRKLKAIKLAHAADSTQELVRQVGCSQTSLNQWLKVYLEQGLAGLVRDISHQAPERLSNSQREELEQILLERQPCDWGLEGYFWTGELAGALIEKQFGVVYSRSGVYKLLKRMGLSHQKAHRDYGNADKGQQAAFVETLKKTPRVACCPKVGVL
jgi:transposase